MLPSMPSATHNTPALTVRPIYTGQRRSLRGYTWGIYGADGVLRLITVRYPSRLMRDIGRARS